MPNAVQEPLLGPAARATEKGEAARGVITF